MDGVIRRQGKDGWTYFLDPFQLLVEAVADASQVIFRVEWPILESVTAQSAVMLARRLLGDSVQVDVATPHPDVSWLTPVFRAGASRLYLAQEPCSWPWAGPSPEDRRYALDEVCPAMTQQVLRNHPISLCRRHHGGMVVASHHLRQWCTGSNTNCPFAGN